MKRIAEISYRYSIIFFFIPIMVILLFINMISRTYIDYGEKIFFLHKSMVKPIACIAFFLVVSVFLVNSPIWIGVKKYLETKRNVFLAIWCGLSLAILGISLFWVLSTQIVPFADSLWLHECAVDMRNGIKEQFETGYYNYMDLYPFQCKTLLMFYIIDFVSGGYNPIIYQIINCFCVVAIYNFLALFALRFFDDRLQALLTLGMGIIWLPTVLYTSFIYGNIPSIALSLAAIFFWTEYIESDKKLYSVLAAFLIALALDFKSQAMIFFVGMLIYATVYIVIHHCYKKFLSFIIMALFMATAIIVPKRIVVAITDCPMDQGMSSVSWLNMGLSYNDAGAPGWYSDDAKRDYAEAGFKSEGHKIISNERLKGNVSKLLGDSEYASVFFLQKTASQYNDPTFQSMWFMRDGRSGMSSFWAKFISYRNYLKVSAVLDIFWEFFLTGSLLYMLFNRRTIEKPVLLLLPMIAVGIFIFHSVWEAKAQYIMFFTVLLIPMSVNGFVTFAKFLHSFIVKRKEKLALKGMKTAELFTIVMLCLSLLLVSVTVLKGYSNSITKDNETFAAYLEENYPLE